MGLAHAPGSSTVYIRNRVSDTHGINHTGRSWIRITFGVLRSFTPSSPIDRQRVLFLRALIWNFRISYLTGKHVTGRYKPYAFFVFYHNTFESNGLFKTLFSRNVIIVQMLEAITKSKMTPPTMRENIENKCTQKINFDYARFYRRTPCMQTNAQKYNSSRWKPIPSGSTFACA